MLTLLKSFMLLFDNKSNVVMIKFHYYRKNSVESTSFT